MSKNALHDPIWFTPPDGSSRVLWKDSPSPPPAPDYTGAAVATAQGNQQAATTATKANRVNQYSPYGSSTYSQADPNDPNSQWSQNISLSPVGQQLLNSLNSSQLGTANLEQGATNQVGNTMGQPFNTNGIAPIPTADAAARQHAEDTAYSAATSRLDPQWQQRQQMSDTQLRNQGLAPGSEAYDAAKRDLGYQQNDAYQQAQAAAVGQGLQNQQSQFNMGLAANQTGLQEGLSLYNQPLNTLNALRSASQVTTPQFGNVPQQQTVGGPNYSGAAGQTGAYDQALYNQQAQNANSFNTGLFGIGAGIATAPAGGFLSGLFKP